MTDQSIGLPATPDIAKAQAKRLRSALISDFKIGHNQALELIARVHGEQSWGRLNSLIGPATHINPEGGAPSLEARGDAAGSASLPPNHVEQRVLQALWRGIESAKNTTVSPKTRAKAKALLKDEIIGSIALEEWLDTLDVNLGGMVFDMGSENLLKISEVATVSRFQRPRSRDTSVSGFIGLRPAAFAAVLIWLERLGFDTHPEVFYEPLMDGLKRAKYIDSEELACLWHSRERKNRFETRKYFVDATTKIENIEHQVVKFRHGLTVDVARSTDQIGLIDSLRIYR